MKIEAVSSGKFLRVDGGHRKELMAAEQTNQALNPHHAILLFHMASVFKASVFNASISTNDVPLGDERTMGNLGGI
jgi:hypothetical protein